MPLTSAVDLVRPTGRAARLGVVAAGPALGLAVLGLFSLTAHPVAPLLVLVGLVVTAPAGYLLDDPAAGVLAASPTSLPRRNGLRLALGVPVLVAGWLVIIGRSHFLEGFAALSVGDLAVEVGGFAAFSLAVAAVAARLGDEHPGTTASIALVMAAAGLLVAQEALPSSWPVPLLEPGPHTGRWWAAVVVCLAVLVWASRDPWACGGQRLGYSSVSLTTQGSTQTGSRRVRGRAGSPRSGWR